MDKKPAQPKTAMECLTCGAIWREDQTDASCRRRGHKLVVFEADCILPAYSPEEMNTERY